MVVLIGLQKSPPPWARVPHRIQGRIAPAMLRRKRPAIPGRTAAPTAAFRNRRLRDSGWFGPRGAEGGVAGVTVLGGCGGGLPGTRQELVNTALGPARGEFAQDIGQVSKGRDTVQRARPGEAIENRRPLRRTMRAEEEKIVPAQGDSPQLLFA